jgi:hypothetical protein
MSITPDIQIITVEDQTSEFERWVSAAVIRSHSSCGTITTSCIAVRTDWAEGEMREHAEAEVLRKVDPRRSPSIHPDEWEGSPGMIGLYGVTDPFRPKYEEDWDLYYKLLQQEGTHQ